MSCVDCEIEQESKEYEYYFRIGGSNILVYGCKEHIALLQ